MPGGGIKAASQITTALPDTAVVMLTASRDDDDLFDALRAGASGYLLKDMDPDRLAAALRGVMAGEAALPRSLALKVMRQLQSPGRRRLLPAQGLAGLEADQPRDRGPAAHGRRADDGADR